MAEANTRAALEVLGAFGRSRLYVAAWLMALVLAVAAPTYGAVTTFTRPPAWTPFGVTAGFHFRQIFEVFGTEARASGIKPLDYIVAIDDMPVEHIDPARSIVRSALAKSPGAPIELTLRHERGGPATRHILHWRNENIALGERMWGRMGEGGSKTATMLGLVQALILICSAALLFGRRRDPVAATMSLALLLVAAGYGIGEVAFYELGFWKGQLATAFLGFSLLLAGLLTFPAGRFEPQWTAAAALLVPVWAVTGFFFNDEATVAVGLAYLALGATALLGIRSRYRRFSTDAERQQVRWFMLGLAVFLCFSVIQLTLIARAEAIGGGPDGRNL